MEIEIGARQDHKHDDRDFEAEMIVLTDTAVFGAESPGGHGAEGVAEGFKEIHTLDE